MRTTFANFAILASSLLVKEAFAAPVQEKRATYLDTDIVMVTEEVTVTEMPDGSYHTGAALAIGTATIDGTPVLYTAPTSAAPVSTPSSSAVEIPATTSAKPVASVESSSTGAVFIQNTHASSSTPIVQVPTTSAAPIVATTLATKASTTPKPAPTSATSAAAVATSASSSPSGSGKRGLAYNDASLLSAFKSSSITWAYNWGASTSSIASTGLAYIPMLWGLSSQNTASWSATATKAIAAGAPALLGFNEPDYSQQANLGYADAAAGWMTYMEPFAGKTKLVSPAVTNGGSPMGLTWMKNFIGACSKCTIDAVAIHWYNGGDAAAFKTYIANAYAAGGNRPLWITEFQFSGTTDEQNAALQEVIPFLDSSNMVEKYAYFMASDGILLSSGTTLSSLGNTFATFV